MLNFLFFQRTDLNLLKPHLSEKEFLDANEPIRKQIKVGWSYIWVWVIDPLAIIMSWFMNFDALFTIPPKKYLTLQKQWKQIRPRLRSNSHSDKGPHKSALSCLESVDNLEKVVTKLWLAITRLLVIRLQHILYQYDPENVNYKTNEIELWLYFDIFI